MRRARNAQDASALGLDAPTTAPVSNSLRTTLRDAIVGGEVFPEMDASPPQALRAAERRQARLRGYRKRSSITKPGAMRRRGRAEL